ncbi:hypothetical protein B0H13DRAFT_2364521 [Mycena leptocephala]|nr:hypothetical protein B0H13DRAFT_2364521 [Mycena leptocephala]
MSFMDKYSLADYTSTFEDASNGASPDSFAYFYSITNSPHPQRVQNDATIDTYDEDFLTEDFDKLVPSYDELLGAPMASLAWIIPEEPICFLSPQKERQPALPVLTRAHPHTTEKGTAVHHPLVPRELPRVARVASPAEPIDLCTDDEEDCDAQIKGKGELEKSDSSFRFSAPSNGAPSPPLSSEAPSPASTRDFDTFADGGSESWSRGSSQSPVEWEDVHKEHEAHFGPDYTETDDDADGELDEDEEGEDELRVDAENNASIHAHLPRPIIPLPARAQVGQTPSLVAPSSFIDPSRLSLADAADSDDDQNDFPESEEDDDSDYAAPASKRRHSNSGKPTAVAPKRATKGKGKAKAREPKRRLVNTNPPESIQAAADGAPAVRASAPAMDSKWIEIRENLYLCLSGGCTLTTRTANGVSRHFKLDHENMAPEGGGGRREVLRKHLDLQKRTCKASLAKKKEALAQLAPRRRAKKA